MKYSQAENILSIPRLRRYLVATNNDTRRAMTLYRKNVLLSQDMFAVIGYFEVTLRNRIDQHFRTVLGDNWIRSAADTIFLSNKCMSTREHIVKKVISLGEKCTQDKLVSEMEFGFWRFLFATNQFTATGSTLLKISPNKPKSNMIIQYNHSCVFDELRKINNIRNRIAHHEPICFDKGTATIASGYTRDVHKVILDLFNWMAIDEKSLTRGLDHVLIHCDDIDNLSRSIPKSTSPSSSP